MHTASPQQCSSRNQIQGPGSRYSQTRGCRRSHPTSCLHGRCCLRRPTFGRALHYRRGQAGQPYTEAWGRCAPSRLVHGRPDSSTITSGTQTPPCFPLWGSASQAECCLLLGLPLSKEADPDLLLLLAHHLGVTGGRGVGTWSPTATLPLLGSALGGWQAPLPIRLPGAGQAHYSSQRRFLYLQDTRFNLQIQAESEPPHLTGQHTFQDPISQKQSPHILRK